MSSGKRKKGSTEKHDRKLNRDARLGEGWCFVQTQNKDRETDWSVIVLRNVDRFA